MTTLVARVAPSPGVGVPPKCHNLNLSSVEMINRIEEIMKNIVLLNIVVLIFLFCEIPDSFTSSGLKKSSLVKLLTTH